MKKEQVQKSRFTIKGYLLFFLLVSGVATCSILAYTYIFEKSGENKAVTAILTLIILLCLALLCTAIDAARRKYTVQRPVNRIIDATRRITEGDFSVKLEPFHSFGKYDEFDIIIENINRMTAELNKNEVLKADFIANVSHEIKTPLAVIQNYAAGLCNKKLTERTREEYAKTLTDAAERLSDLITNILKLNKLENQEILPQKKRFNIGEQLRESVLAFEDKFEKKGFILKCDIDDVAVVSDAACLEIIWNNLLSNAIKFTPDGGSIGVSVKAVGEFVIVSFSDTGSGIPKEAGERIFDKFYQADASRSTQGNGLGLALVKRVIDILGGEISVESEEGKGSAFTIKIRRD